MVRNSDPGQSMQIVAPQQVSVRTMPALERQVDEAITTRAARVDLDLHATQTIDSAGLNWLLNAQSRLATAGVQLRLTRVPAIVSDIFLATRLDHRFIVVEAEASNA